MNQRYAGNTSADLRDITNVPCHCEACVWSGVTGQCDDDYDANLICPACGAFVAVEYNEHERNPTSGEANGR